MPTVFVLSFSATDMLQWGWIGYAQMMEHYNSSVLDTLFKIS